MKKNSILLFFLAYSLLISSCKNTQAKVLEFVNNYNKSANRSVNHIINRTYAETITHETTDDIKIVFVLNVKEGDPNIENYKLIFPSLITSVLEMDEDSKTLVKEGVKFQVIFTDIDNNVIKRVIADEQQLAAASKANLQKKGDDQLSNDRLSPELKQVLTMLNKSLPIENKEEGTKLMKIDVNALNELVYKFEVNTEMKAILKSPNANELVKNEILRNPNVKNMITYINRYGLQDIKYIYIDEHQKPITEIVIKAADLR